MVVVCDNMVDVMAITQFSSRVSKITFFNHKFCLVHLELIKPSRFSFVAGQYILLDVPGTEQKKSYSIASAPEMSHAIELLVDISPGGVGCEYIKKLKPGDSVTFRGPVGAFVIDQSQGKELVFVATGSGISSLRSMLLDQLITRGDKRKIRLYWGLRYVTDLFWEEDFYQMDEDYENLEVEIILSRPPDEWKLSSGYVTDALQVLEKDFSSKSYYLCGGASMIQDVRALLEKKGVLAGNIHFEKYY